MEKNVQNEIQNDVQESTNTKTESSSSAELNMKPSYYFGGIKEYSLEEIETQILSDSVYLDVFAGSDMRIKTDINPIEGALQKITAIEGVHFHWANNKKQGKQTGVIAQAVAAKMPELVAKDKETGVLAVNYSKMIPYLIESIKELNLRISHLELELKQSKH